MKAFIALCALFAVAYAAYPPDAFDTMNTDIKITNGVCDVPGRAECGGVDNVGGNRFQFKGDCDCPYVSKNCPAFCGKCTAKACYNNNRQLVKIGQSWTDAGYGTFKCTVKGIVILKKGPEYISAEKDLEAAGAKKKRAFRRSSGIL